MRCLDNGRGSINTEWMSDNHVCTPGDYYRFGGTGDAVNATIYCKMFNIFFKVND